MNALTVGQDTSAAGVHKRAGLIGWPARHSLSPTLHRAGWASLGLEGWAYGIQEIHPDALSEVIQALDESWAGLSVTMPHKQSIMPMLDLIDGPAKTIGAVNTVLVQHGGLLIGANTDATGILNALNEARQAGGYPSAEQTDSPTNGGNSTPWPRKAVVLGARATASSATFALGSVGVRNISVLARRIVGPGSVLVAAHGMGINLEHIQLDSETAVERLCDADVVISTLPAHVADRLATRLCDRIATGGELRPGSVLLDAVYNPSPTALAEAWTTGGGLVAPGWAMLLHQAVEQVRMMTAQQPDIDAMRSALLDELGRRAHGPDIPNSPIMFPNARLSDNEPGTPI